MIHSRFTRANIVHLVLQDTALVMAAYAIAFALRFYTKINLLSPLLPPAGPNIEQYVFFTLVFSSMWPVVIAVEGGYSRRYLFAGNEEYRRIFHAAAFAVLLTILMIFFVESNISRGYIATSWVLAVAFLTFGRYLYRRYLHTRNRRSTAKAKILMVGANHEAADLAQAIHKADHFGAEVVGALNGQGPGDERLVTLGDIEDLKSVVAAGGIDAVVLVPSALGTAATAAYRDLKDIKCDVFIAPSLRDVLASRINVQPVGGTPLIHIEPVRIEGVPRAIKRAFDFVVASLLTLPALPFLLLMAVAIRLESKGPSLFTQTRCGRDGREFTLYKFRSMVIDAESRLDELIEHNEADGHIFKMKQDPRVTRVGGFLRRWSLDELPQLFNVIKGDMSLVGPRPPIPAEVANYNEWEMNRLGTVPGMTGYWQVSGRSDVSFSDMVKMDVFYIENWSLTLDIYILMQTTKVVLSRKGAY